MRRSCPPNGVGGSASGGKTGDQTCRASIYYLVQYDRNIMLAQAESLTPRSDCRRITAEKLDRREMGGLGALFIRNR